MAIDGAPSNYPQPRLISQFLAYPSAAAGSVHTCAFRDVQLTERGGQLNWPLAGQASFQYGV
jgi:hypothetical protein